MSSGNVAHKVPKSSMRRLYKATLYSLVGLKSAWQNETAFREELLLCFVLIPIAFWVGNTLLQRVILISSLLFVLVIELINSAIEAVVDRIGSEHHILSGRAKDFASAAVLISLINASICWILVLIDRLSA